MILEYKLHASDKGMCTPAWIEDGGYFGNPDNNTYIGITTNTEHYIPETVKQLTLQQLQDRQVLIHNVHPMRLNNDDDIETVMTVAEVQTLMESWYNDKENI
jgi:hypothetical protein